MEIKSLRWNIIKYESDTEFRDIIDILSKRFDNKLSDYDITDLHDPYLLNDMDKAIDRIKIAVNEKQRIVVFWDYDVDWVTSTSILVHFFKKIWAQISYRLPHRVQDWYWMKKYFIDELKPLDVKLIITVDCWTKDIDVIKYAKENGIDIIVTDHHAVPDVIPKEAIAIINPKRKDCNYPFKHLAWAWVSYKLMMALAKEYFSDEEYLKYLNESIDIAAIWTVADCMPLIWENRIIVSLWLNRIKNSRSIWIKKLISDKIEEDLDADIFWFLIWPRINAAGRLDTPYKALNLILNNWDKIDDVIFEIENINTRRKELTKLFYEDSLTKIDGKNKILFYDSQEIEHWIIWIVAWRLTEEFHKPSIVLKDEWEKLVASCRSPEYFSIINILEKYKEYFLHFWWHKQAAWFSISKEVYPIFKEKITQEINNIEFQDDIKIINIDKIVSIDQLWFNLFEKTQQFKPFWIWNPKPVFLFRDLNIDWVEYMWKTKDHITIKNKYWIKIVWFNMGGYYDLLKSKYVINLVFELDVNIWMGKRSLSCRIIDFF